MLHVPYLIFVVLHFIPCDLLFSHKQQRRHHRRHLPHHQPSPRPLIHPSPSPSQQPLEGPQPPGPPLGPPAARRPPGRSRRARPSPADPESLRGGDLPLAAFPLRQAAADAAHDESCQLYGSGGSVLQGDHWEYPHGAVTGGHVSVERRVICAFIM